MDFFWPFGSPSKSANGAGADGSGAGGGGGVGGGGSSGDRPSINGGNAQVVSSIGRPLPVRGENKRGLRRD